MKSRLEEIQSKIPSGVTLVAVSKTQPIEAIETLYRLGQKDFGENYVQELVTKAQALERLGIKDIRWHFIGHLQTNKVKMLLPHCYTIHSVDSEKLAKEISARAEKSIPIFVEVNLNEETSKTGIKAEQAAEICSKIAQLPKILLQGLMCIPNPNLSEEELKLEFSRLNELEKKCRPHTQGKLSMGMSADFELAIQCGATHVRVGTALFGKRCSAPFG